MFQKRSTENYTTNMEWRRLNRGMDKQTPEGVIENGKYKIFGTTSCVAIKYCTGN